MGFAAQSRPEGVVMVVDDEPLACRIIARVLVDAGFQVVEVHSSIEALRLLSTLEGSVQLVVSDIAMPGLTGVQLAAQIKYRWPAVPVLLLSGYAVPSDYAGAFVAKPFTWDALLDAVGSLIPLPHRSPPKSQMPLTS
jgi:CheY-like chemotaxis protein